MGCAAELVSGSGVRCEEDALGQIAVPAGAYFGAHSQRAAETFAGAGAPLGSYPALVRSLALVKKAAALANVSAGSLDPQLGAAITEACDDVAAGRLLDDFVVGILVPSDTAFNMNANEVLANRANELLGSARGTYRPVHPLTTSTGRSPRTTSSIRHCTSWRSSSPSVSRRLSTTSRARSGGRPGRTRSR